MFLKRFTWKPARDPRRRRKRQEYKMEGTWKEKHPMRKRSWCHLITIIFMVERKRVRNDNIKLSGKQCENINRSRLKCHCCCAWQNACHDIWKYDKLMKDIYTNISKEMSIRNACLYNILKWSAVACELRVVF